MIEHRSIRLIAEDIIKDWGPTKINYAALPYLQAMQNLSSISDRYFYDSAEEVVRYFLCNATTWRGEKARAIKLELNQMLKNKAESK